MRVRAEHGSWGPSQDPGPAGATFELAVHEVLLALLQEQQQTLQLLTVILSNGFKDLPAIIQLEVLLRPSGSRVLGRGPAGQKTPSSPALISLQPWGLWSFSGSVAKAQDKPKGGKP